MKYLVGLAVILVGAYFFPQISQSVGGPCQALESKVVAKLRNEDSNLGAVAGLVAGLSNGKLGMDIAEREYPSLPTTLGCVLSYYTVDPREIRI